MPFTPEQRRQYDKERAAQRRAAQICVNCNEPAVKWSRCQAHYEAEVERRKK